jgi:hypothetical protein
VEDESLGRNKVQGDDVWLILTVVLGFENFKNNGHFKVKKFQTF